MDPKYISNSMLPSSYPPIIMLALLRSRLVVDNVLSSHSKHLPNSRREGHLLLSSANVLGKGQFDSSRITYMSTVPAGKKEEEEACIAGLIDSVQLFPGRTSN